jgi:hypothetical protein
MSDSLVKIIDKSILPASIMIVSKFFGIALAVNLFGVEWYVNYGTNFWSVYPVVGSQDILLVSSISDIVMLTALLGGLVYYVLQAVIFHDSHINPRTVARLVKYNLLGVINNSSKIYYSAGVWGGFALFAIVLTVINILTLKTYWWVGLIAILIFIISVMFLVKDVEEEIDRAKKNLSF